MTYKMTDTCMDVLARAYYGLELLSDKDTPHKRQARRVSIKSNRALEWIDWEGRITEQGLWALSRAVRTQL